MIGLWRTLDDIIGYLFTAPLRDCQGVLDRLHQLSAQTGRRILIAYVCLDEQRILERHFGFSKFRDYRFIVDEHRWSLWECRGERPARAPRRPS